MTIHYDDLFAGKGPNTPRGRVARGRHTPGKMNKLESRYAEHLEYRRLKGEILWWMFEGITLKLASDCRLTIDFAAMMADCELVMFETKGFRRDDAMVKLRVAASMFPLRIVLVEEKKGAGWVETEVK